MKRKNRLFENIIRIKSLKKAWSKIYQNGRQSDSKLTKDAVKKFKQNEEDNLKKLRKKLQTKDFNFGSARGLGIKKNSGKSRPLVSTSIEMRIVQRAILVEIAGRKNLHTKKNNAKEIAQKTPGRKEIKKYFEVKTSFGAIPNQSVRKAIEAVVEAIKTGSTYYIKSDIADFFTKIPRKLVIEQISSFWNDNDFAKLLEQVTNIEIDNLIELEKQYGPDFRDKFIFEVTGAPQGCCLSPLMGNILLYDFDCEMNTHDIKCLRYLDDFLILGPDEKSVRGAYRKAQKLLSKHNLQAYDLTNKDKTAHGPVNRTFVFLGIEISNRLIRPSNSSQKNLVEKVNALLKELFEKYDKRIPPKGLVKLFFDIGNVIKGWGNHYKFCNDDKVMNSLDAKLSKNVIECFYKFCKNIAGQPQDIQRKLIGVHSLHECKKEPIKFASEHR